MLCYYMNHWNENIITILSGEYKKVKPDTLFSEYLIYKIDNYVEPWRMGTPKGDPIGISRIKYQACLFMLTSLMQKVIAEKLNISFGVLRKWNTESEFKTTLTQHCKEFVDKCARYMNDTIDDSIQIARDIERHETNAMALTKFDKMEDNEMYGKCIRERLRDNIYEMINRTPKYDKAIIMQYYLINTYFNKNKTQPKAFKLYQRSLAESMLTRLRHILTNNLYEQRKAEADFIISKLETYIHTLE
jgi:hypothetical protein